MGSAVVALRLSCSQAYGLFLDQESGDTGDAGSIPGLGRWIKRRGEGIVDEGRAELRGSGVGKLVLMARKCPRMTI